MDATTEAPANGKRRDEPGDGYRQDTDAVLDHAHATPPDAQAINRKLIAKWKRYAQARMDERLVRRETADLVKAAEGELAEAVEAPAETDESATIKLEEVRSLWGDLKEAKNESKEKRTAARNLVKAAAKAFDDLANNASQLTMFEDDSELEDLEADAPAGSAVGEPPEDGEVDVEMLRSLDDKTLRAFAKRSGVKPKKGESRDDLIERIREKAAADT